MPNRDIHRVNMDIAQITATMSYAERKKVGAVIAKDGRIISTGYNGMCKGSDNVCEVKTPSGLISSPEVVHAEANAILFAARNGQSTEGCTLYITMSPCIECAKMIIQCGIKEVYYDEDYRDSSGKELLIKNKITIKQI